MPLNTYIGKQAGKDHKTGEKSYLLSEFERKYKSSLFLIWKNTIRLIFPKPCLPDADQKNQI
jgi:tryptophan 2,3-dioxygenase